MTLYPTEVSLFPKLCPQLPGISHQSWQVQPGDDNIVSYWVCSLKGTYQVSPFDLCHYGYQWAMPLLQQGPRCLRVSCSGCFRRGLQFEARGTPFVESAKCFQKVGRTRCRFCPTKLPIGHWGFDWQCRFFQKLPSRHKNLHGVTEDQLSMCILKYSF